jgi:hypothetical protein
MEAVNTAFGVRNPRNPNDREKDPQKKYIASYSDISEILLKHQSDIIKLSEIIAKK